MKTMRADTGAEGVGRREEQGVHRADDTPIGSARAIARGFTDGDATVEQTPKKHQSDCDQQRDSDLRRTTHERGRVPFEVFEQCEDEGLRKREFQPRNSERTFDADRYSTGAQKGSDECAERRDEKSANGEFDEWPEVGMTTIGH